MYCVGWSNDEEANDQDRDKDRDRDWIRTQVEHYVSAAGLSDCESYSVYVVIFRYEYLWIVSPILYM